MSTWSDRTIACPRCSASVRARIALGAHIGRVPEVRDAVLARTFHRFPCAACGMSIQVHARFEYTDIERRQLVLVGLPPEVRTWQELETTLNTTIDRALEHGSPLVAPFVREVKRRVVFGVEELREKLVVWDAGLDDGLVECIKVRAYASDPTLAAPGSRLHVDAVSEGDVLRCKWFPSPDAAPDKVLELPDHWVADAVRDRESLEARFPELFRGGFVSVDRL
ncbi:MAG: hypothetical protein H0T46_08960 [Deltaproteobacteria bacterium]|nr:hypothetical protein [Deltaproteobacteria bacterium]